MIGARRAAAAICASARRASPAGRAARHGRADGGRRHLADEPVHLGAHRAVGEGSDRERRRGDQRGRRRASHGAQFEVNTPLLQMQSTRIATSLGATIPIPGAPGTASRPRWRRSARCSRTGRARSSSTARAARSGAALAAGTSRRDAALCRPRRGDGRDARERSRVLPARAARGRRPARAARRCSSCRRPIRRLTPTMQPDRRTTLRRMAALFRLSQGFAPRVLVASAAALFRRVVPRAPFDALCEVIASGSTLEPRRDDRGAGAAPGSRARRWSRTRARSPCAARSSICSRPSTASGPDRAVRRRGRVDSPLRRGDAADAAPARRRPHPPGARDHRDRGRRSAGADPGRRRRGRVSVVEDAPAAGAGRGGRAVLRHRVAGPRVPRRHGAAVRLPAGGRAVRGRGSRGGDRGGAPAGDAGCARRPPRATSSTGWRCRRRGLRARRGRGGGGAGGAAAARAARRWRSRASTRRPTRRRASASNRRRTPRCARSCTRRAPRRSARARHEIDIGTPLRDRLRGWLDLGHRVRVVAPNRTHADRLVALLRALGFATDVRAAARRSRAVRRRGRAAPLAVLSGPLRRGFALPADRLVVVAEEEIFGARALREARASKAAGPRRSGRDRRRRRRRPRRARHRALPRPQEADRARRPRRLHAPRVRRRRRSTCPSTASALVHRYLGGEAGEVKLDKLGARHLAREAPPGLGGGTARSPRS